MSTEPYSLRGRAGDTFKRVLQHRESDGETAVNLSGASVEWALRNAATEFQYIDTAQATITNAAQGEITLILTPAETRALEGQNWEYEVTLTFADTTRLTILDGFLSVGREVVA